MAAEPKAPTLAEEYSLPPQDVPVEKMAEKPDIATEAEAVPASNDEAPPADETPAAVDDNADKSEAEGKNTAAEETDTAAEETDTAAEETTDTAEKEEAEEKAEIKIETAPADFRFPTTNQSRHCFTRYVEYHRCVAAKGDDAPECDKFAKYYRSLCPGEWVDRWNEQRENGTFPGPL